MAALLEKISQGYNYVFYELCDDRTRDYWPNVGTLATILLGYLYFCKTAGPAWMKDKKPYQLTTIIFYYNIFQIIISAYIFVTGFGIWFNEYNWICQPVIVEDTPSNMIGLVWVYANLKLIELLDTIFFVLRKKDRQISGLHLYHHFAMPICGWIAIKYYPNGHSTMLGLINCFVHLIMYTYYLIAGLGPQYQKHLWWKKHVTILQLVQFVIIFFHNIAPLIRGCNYPKWVNVLLGLGSLHFVYMFGSFYYENYIKTPQKNVKKVKKVE